MARSRSKSVLYNRPGPGTSKSIATRVVPPLRDLPPEREYEWLCSVRTKLHYLDFTQAFCIFDADFRNTFYDESRSHAYRTINPENVITNKQMNFTVSTPVIWTRPVVHVFSILQMSGRSCQWDSTVVRLDLP
jgi:hypothetical protein